MIGINLSCVSFCGVCWACVIYCKIKSLTAEIIFADENSNTHKLIVGRVHTEFFLHMRNLVSSYKILVCENYRWSSCLKGAFVNLILFITPIILDVLHAPRGFSFLFFSCGVLVEMIHRIT